MRVCSTGGHPAPAAAAKISPSYRRCSSARRAAIIRRTADRDVVIETRLISSLIDFAGFSPVAGLTPLPPGRISEARIACLNLSKRKDFILCKWTFHVHLSYNGFGEDHC
ncbi:hypothetical protein AAHA92_05874 [Salvia divinorum]|uniref:Uncharacterized protein n=1 Tax=Salvia divinorum TaxID=28513 RepID=A0ABD1I3U1_SALDI